MPIEISKQIVETLNNTEELAVFLKSVKKDFNFTRNFIKQKELKDKFQSSFNESPLATSLDEIDKILKKGVFYKGKSKFNKYLDSIQINTDSQEILSQFVKVLIKSLPEEEQGNILTSVKLESILPVSSTSMSKTPFKDEQYSLTLSTSTDQTTVCSFDKAMLTQLVTDFDSIQDKLNELT